MHVSYYRYMYKHTDAFNRDLNQDKFFFLYVTDVSQPKGDWKTEDIASVGELILDISIQLARQ